MCIKTPYFDRLLCGLPCYLLTSWGTFDLFFDVITPVLIIFLCNLALFLRVVCQNTIVIGRVVNHRRRQRKLAIQLALISFIYLAVWMPLSIIQLGQIYIDPTFLLNYLNTFNFLVYIVPLILPMICLLSMSEILKQLKTLIFLQRHAAVVPLHMT
jgi:phosphatidylglycerophosphate synthase